jgi:hypothetical protein
LLKTNYRWGALIIFSHENNGRLPSEISQLKPYLNQQLGNTLDDATLNAIFDRYILLPSDNPASGNPGNPWIIAEKTPVDKDYDSRAKFGLGTSTVYRTGAGESGDPNDPTY